MPAGIYIENQASGSVQIDENYKNLSFRAKGTATVATVGGLHKATVTHVGENPVIAIRPTGAFFIGLPFIAVSGAGNAFTWTFFSTEPTGSFDYWIFDNPPAADNGNGGLQVFDGAGKKTYDSNYPPLRIVDFWKGTVWDQVDSKTYPAGRTYAAIIAWPGTQANGMVGPSDMAVWTRGVRWSSATTLQRGRVPCGSVTNAFYLQFGFAQLIVDVTNF